ncbi:N-(5'-phosphoribosyl)anthranilate isomerase 3, chloroplastic, partial [Tetrabaena socialis]
MALLRQHLNRQLLARGAERRNARRCCRAMAGADRPSSGPLVKICGLTNPEDAQTAVSAGADMLGMIMWQKAKRAVSAETAAAIAGVARRGGARAVGVFVDEDAATISARCLAAGIPVAQLHGDGARSALPDLDPSLEVVYVLNCSHDGAPLTQPPSRLLEAMGRAGARLPEWVLLDGVQVGDRGQGPWE